MDEKKKPSTDTAMGTLALWEETAEHSLAPHLAYWLRYNISGREPKAAGQMKRLLDERAALLSVLEAAEQGEDKDIFRHDDQCDAVWLQENGRFGLCTCGLGALYDAIAKARAAVSGGGE